MSRIGLVCILLIGMCVGCIKMPSGARASLITAEICLRITEADANSAKVPPWVAESGETPQQTIDRLNECKTLLRAVMRQADKNLIEVLRWSEGSVEGLPNE